MTDLITTRFTDFFRAVHGYDPFDWQECFAGRVLEGGGWPNVIRVPTGCGKTSILDLALFELALQARKAPEERTAARRICFVVDRRLVVDEAADHARRLQKAILLTRAGKCDNPELKEVTERLTMLAADPAEPLRVVRLRGGVYRDDGWAGDPLTPTILVSTVDQIGSRLLFRGYGVSERSRSVHAGLLAFDTRIILDEAHLSTVFAETLDRIRKYQQWAEESPLPENRCVSVVRMSATAGEDRNIFELTDAMRRDKRLKPRLKACKRAKLCEVKVDAIPKKTQKEQARRLEEQNRESFVLRLVQEAKDLAGFSADGTITHDQVPRVIGIVVNRVATARQIYDQLQKRLANEPASEVILLTGRIRPIDRDQLLEKWLPRISANRNRTKKPECPLFVVATQTVEVGANLDFEALVTEAAPLDALRQRFGRLDRLGIRHEQNLLSPASILVRSDRVPSEKQLMELDKRAELQDPIYGNAIAHTWNFLNHKDNATSEGHGKSKSTWIDFGINNLDLKLSKDHCKLHQMLAPQPAAPVLFPAHLDAWVRTNPMPDPDPDVAPFLHGQAGTSADIRVVWRADLEKENQKVWIDIVRQMPPRTREALPIPVYEARAWLQKQARGDVADVEGVMGDGGNARKEAGLRVLRWRGMRDVCVIRHDDVEPGDTIVVPAAYGGTDESGWKPSDETPVTDVAETCLAQLIASYPANAFRVPKLRFRLCPSLIDALGTTPPVKERLKERLGIVLAALESDAADPQPPLRRLLATMKEHLGQSILQAAIDALLGAPKLQIELYPQHNGLTVIAAVKLSLPEEQVAPPEETEDEDPDSDEASNITSGVEILLRAHALRTEETVRRFTLSCGLGGAFQKALPMAARWHDEGKSDPRFQAWLHGSELKSLAALAKGQVLAKSIRYAKQNSRFGYPRGGRHEFVSVRLFETAFKDTGNNSLHELAKYLIGAHHGHGRPFAPVLPKGEEMHPVQVDSSQNGMRISVSSDHGLYRLDSGWTDLFWCMVRRFGWWGLSFLEALVITADHLASAQEQQQSTSDSED